jgi:flavin reductase (DIM6/NTAB) family NADH-FMN oxidoreductase RutF
MTIETKLETTTTVHGYGASRALAEMPYGLYIVGSRSDEVPNGMMADWVMQVAFEPRLVAVSIENDAHTLANVNRSGVFSVNLLSADEFGLAAKFAQPYFGSKVSGRGSPARDEVHHKLDGVRHEPGAHTGCPVLTDALAWLECHVRMTVPLGDHTLVIGRVVDGGVLHEGEPLTSLITGWPYSG